MATRINLCPNPALKSNATGWSLPSGYARSASVTTLPRSTGVKGTSTPSNTIVSPQCSVVAGRQYCISFSIHYTNVSGVNTFTYGIDWYNSGSYLSSSTYSTRTSAAFGITERLEHGPVTAPTGATSGVLVLENLDSGCEVTAVLFENTATNGLGYFDGDSTGPKATWAGTSGNSISYLLTASDVWSLTETATKVQTAVGPTGTDQVRWSESATVVASGTAVETFTWSESALIISVGYDSRRGRVRVSAFGLAAGAVRAEVLTRPSGRGRFTPVRGGKVAIVNGAFARIVDDYEFVVGLPIDYQIVLYASPQDAPDVITGEAFATIPAIDPVVWIKFIAKPALNRQVTLVGWDRIKRSNRNSPYVVEGRSDPIVVTDVHSSRTVTINVRTSTIADGEALDQALRSGIPAFLHTPDGLALPTMYVAVGDYDYARPNSYSHVRTWTIDLTEVAPPPASIFGPSITWADIIAGYPTWADVLAEFPTWRDLSGA